MGNFSLSLGFCRLDFLSVTEPRPGVNLRLIALFKKRSSTIFIRICRNFNANVLRRGDFGIYLLDSVVPRTR